MFASKKITHFGFISCYTMPYSHIGESRKEGTSLISNTFDKQKFLCLGEMLYVPCVTSTNKFLSNLATVGHKNQQL